MRTEDRVLWTKKRAKAQRPDNSGCLETSEKWVPLGVRNVHGGAAGEAGLGRQGLCAMLGRVQCTPRMCFAFLH